MRNKQGGFTLVELLVVIDVLGVLTTIAMTIYHNVHARSRFFFQAEDGIRDGTVTGVQTCALPIWAKARRSRRRSRATSCGPICRRPCPPLPSPPVPSSSPRRGIDLCDSSEPATAVAGSEDPRSEERRVGKECSTGRLA